MFAYPHSTTTVCQSSMQTQYVKFPVASRWYNAKVRQDFELGNLRSLQIF